MLLLALEVNVYFVNNHNNWFYFLDLTYLITLIYTFIRIYHFEIRWIFRG